MAEPDYGTVGDEIYRIEDWKYEVSSDDTRLGYWEWVEHKKEEGD